MHASTIQRTRAEFLDSLKECGGLSPCATDMMSCIFAAFIAAIPVFIKAMMECKAVQPPATGYAPGDRERCTD